MSKVKVEAILKHDGRKAGDTYEVSDVQAQALNALGLAKPANPTAAKAVEKTAKVE